MRDDVREVVDRLAESRSFAWLRVIEAARLDEPVDVEENVAEVVEPYRWLLGRIGDGLKLTQADYLPPAVVNEAMTTLGWETGWIGKGNREDLTIPVLDLRESAQRFGLVRRYRGRLQVTVAGRKLVDDPQELWWHLAERLPDARSEAERHGGIAYLLFTAAGRPRDDDLLVEALTMLGWRQRSGEPLTDIGAFGAARNTWALFCRLGLVPDKHRWDDPEPAPTAAAVRLARAALIGRGAVRTARPTPQPASRAHAEAVTLTISLRDIDPPVWRQIVAPASLTLRELHAVIQTAMGWRDYHLHMFDVDGVLCGDVEETETSPLGDEETFTVGEAARIGEFTYEYDFGDSWDHDIRVDDISPSVGTDTPRVLAGARACPPEDCGGPSGYSELLEALADPAHEDREHLLEWVGVSWDAEAFDIDATNELLALYDRHTRRRPPR